MNIEIELRYELIDSIGLTDFIQTLTLLHTKRVVDVYLDTVHADLIAQGIYIRLRNDKKIDIKFNRACLADKNLELQPYCEEYSFALPLTQEQLPKFNDVVTDLALRPLAIPDFNLFKTMNSLVEHRTVDKIRTTYSSNELTIMIDQVKDLGTFLEIEVMAADTNALDAVTGRMRALLAPLHLKALKTGYDSLILRKQNFQQYLRGRFVLPEDKQL